MAENTAVNVLASANHKSLVRLDHIMNTVPLDALDVEDAWLNSRVAAKADTEEVKVEARVVAKLGEADVCNVLGCAIVLKHLGPRGRDKARLRWRHDTEVIREQEAVIRARDWLMAHNHGTVGVAVQCLGSGNVIKLEQTSVILNCRKGAKDKLTLKV